MTDKHPNFKKIEEPLTPIKPMDSRPTKKPKLTEDVLASRGLPESAHTVQKDTEPVIEKKVQETTPDASEQQVLLETKPLKKLPAPEQASAVLLPGPKSKLTRRERTEKPVKPVSQMRWVQVRLFPIWLRLLLLLVLLIVAAMVGAMVGFSVIGDGTAGDVFKVETWQHIFDIMNGK